MPTPEMDVVRKALVSVTLEQSLIDVGGNKLLNEVFRVLYEKFQCYLPDCYENPQYLRSIAAEMDEGIFALFMRSVQEKLGEYSYQAPIENFLANLSEIKYESSL